MWEVVAKCVGYMICNICPKTTIALELNTEHYLLSRSASLCGLKLWIVSIFCSCHDWLLLSPLTGLGVFGALNVILSEMSSRPPALLFLEKPLLLRSNPLFSLLIKAAFLDKQWKKEHIWPILGCFTADWKTDAGRHQLHNNSSLALFFHCLHIELTYWRYWRILRILVSVSRNLVF